MPEAILFSWMTIPGESLFYLCNKVLYITIFCYLKISCPQIILYWHVLVHCTHMSTFMLNNLSDRRQGNKLFIFIEIEE